MSDEDRSQIIRISGTPPQELPDGSWELWADTPTLVHHVTLPKTLIWGDKKFYRCGWNSDRKATLYRTGWDTLEEAIKHLL